MEINLNGNIPFIPRFESQNHPRVNLTHVDTAVGSRNPPTVSEVSRTVALVIDDEIDSSQEATNDCGEQYSMCEVPATVSIVIDNQANISLDSMSYSVTETCFDTCFKCSLCGEEKKTRDEMVHHYSQNHFMEDTVKCANCQILFPSKRMLEYHELNRCTNTNFHSYSSNNVLSSISKSLDHIQLQIKSALKCGQYQSQTLEVDMQINTNKDNRKVQQPSLLSDIVTCKESTFQYTKKSQSENAGNVSMENGSMDDQTSLCSGEEDAIENIDVDGNVCNKEQNVTENYTYEQTNTKTQKGNEEIPHNANKIVNTIVTSETPYHSNENIKVGMSNKKKSPRSHDWKRKSSRIRRRNVNNERKDYYSDDELSTVSFEDNSNDGTDNVNEGEYIEDLNLIPHINVERGFSNDIKCTMCDQIFTREKLFIKHYNIVHMNVKKMHQCLLCSKKFDTERSYERHMLLHSDLSPFECNVCGEKFKRKDYWFRHMRRKHRIQRESLDDVKEMQMLKTENGFCCPICKKTFKSAFPCKKHIETHNNPAAMCDICGKTFKKKSAVKSHKLIHTGELPFECQTCSQHFRTRTQLQSHYSVHTGVLPHQCQHCDKKFRLRGSLHKHLRIHHNLECSLLCDVCGAKFVDGYSLKIHKYKHSGREPYQCDQCNRRFVKPSKLKTHINLVHLKIRPYTCHMCGKGFPDSTRLNAHMHKHNGDRPYMCDTCGRGFRYVGNLKRHQKIYTGEKSCVTQGKNLMHNGVILPFSELQDLEDE